MKKSCNNRQEKGITLIALVITIVILIILAVVSINSLTKNDGILNRAKYAKIESKKAQYFEKINLKIIEEQMERVYNTPKELFIVSLKNRLKNSYEKEWISSIIIVKEYEGNTEQIDENNIQELETANLISIVTKDNYVIQIEVNNSTNMATILETFEKSGKICEIKFDGNGGVGTSPSEQRIELGSSILLPENPYEKFGYIFMGWSEEKSSENVKKSNTTYTPKKDTTLYAIWKFDMKDIILSYNIQNNNETYRKEDKTNLCDLSGQNNNAVLYNTVLTDNNKAINFNGTSSYAQLNLQQNLTFPLTVEIDLTTTTTTTNSLIYLEPASGTSFGIYQGEFNCTIYTLSNVIPVPSDFYNGELKHIVITYTSLTNFELYLNGQKQTKISSTDAWTRGVGTIAYLGRREQGNYFNGILYEFNIYNKILDQNEINERYNNAKVIY